MKKILLVIFTFFIYCNLSAQEANWDNNMYTSNKFSYRVETWKHSAEFQTRYKNDVNELEQWHIEYAATYFPSKRWEVVPDIRYTQKPTRKEIRPGLGVIYKNLFKKSYWYFTWCTICDFLKRFL